MYMGIYIYIYIRLAYATKIHTPPPINAYSV